MNVLVNFARLLVEPLGYRVVPLAMLERLQRDMKGSLDRQLQIDALLRDIDAKAKWCQDVLTARGGATSGKPSI